MALDEWVAALAEALAVPADAVDVEALLALAGDAAHAVERPAAPVTTFLVGYAAGRDGGDRAAVAAATDATRALLAQRYGPG